MKVIGVSRLWRNGVMLALILLGGCATPQRGTQDLYVELLVIGPLESLGETNVMYGDVAEHRLAGHAVRPGGRGNGRGNLAIRAARYRPLGGTRSRPDLALFIHRDSHPVVAASTNASNR
jgi:hypothetical protein